MIKKVEIIDIIKLALSLTYSVIIFYGTYLVINSGRSVLWIILPIFLFIALVHHIEVGIICRTYDPKKDKEIENKLFGNKKEK